MIEAYTFRPPIFPRSAYHNIENEEERRRHNAASIIQEWYFEKHFYYDEDQYCWRNCRFFCVCQYEDRIDGQHHGPTQEQQAERTFQWLETHTNWTMGSREGT
jgi:hypothetical protein